MIKKISDLIREELSSDLLFRASEKAIGRRQKKRAIKFKKEAEKQKFIEDRDKCVLKLQELTKIVGGKVELDNQGYPVLIGARLLGRELVTSQEFDTQTFVPETILMDCTRQSFLTRRGNKIIEIKFDQNLVIGVVEVTFDDQRVIQYEIRDIVLTMFEARELHRFLKWFTKVQSEKFSLSRVSNRIFGRKMTNLIFRNYPEKFTTDQFCIKGIHV